MADNTLTTDILFPTLEADNAVSDISTQTPVFSKSV